MKWTSSLFSLSLIQYGFIGTVVGLHYFMPPVPRPEVPLASVASSAPVTRSPGCLIIIDGIRYDIAPFITIHQGGNIFQCGTDMSRIFHNQHSTTLLEQLTPYRLE